MKLFVRMSRILKLMKARPEGKSGREGPRLGWEKYIGELVTRRSKSLPEVKHVARDRTEFRKWLKAPGACRRMGIIEKKIKRKREKKKL